MVGEDKITEAIAESEHVGKSLRPMKCPVNGGRSFSWPFWKASPYPANSIDEMSCPTFPMSKRFCEAGMKPFVARAAVGGVGGS